jgi:hypothetical protein
MYSSPSYALPSFPPTDPTNTGRGRPTQKWRRLRKGERLTPVDGTSAGGLYGVRSRPRGGQDEAGGRVDNSCAPISPSSIKLISSPRLTPSSPLLRLCNPFPTLSITRRNRLWPSKSRSPSRSSPSSTTARSPRPRARLPARTVAGSRTSDLASRSVTSPLRPETTTRNEVVGAVLVEQSAAVQSVADRQRRRQRKERGESGVST